MENKFKLIKENNLKLKKINDFDGKSIEELYNVNKDNIKSCKDKIIESIISISMILPSYSISPMACNVLIGCSLFSIIGLYKAVFKFSIFLESYREYYMNSYEYQDVYQLYLKILNDLSSMFTSLDWDNEIKIFSGYSYLFKKGYLSDNHEFYYSNIIDSCEDLYGCNIISGKGNSVHINSMLTDLLKINYYSACNLGLLINAEDISFLNNLKMLVEEVDYDYNQEENNFIFNYIKKHVKCTNHLATLFENEIHSYVMDACFDTLFAVKENGEIYHGNSEFFCKCTEKYNNEKKINLSNMLKPTSKEEIDKLTKDYYNVLQMCDDYRDIFEKFYREHKDLYEEVVYKRKILVKEYEKYNIYHPSSSTELLK